MSDKLLNVWYKKNRKGGARCTKFVLRKRSRVFSFQGFGSSLPSSRKRSVRKKLLHRRSNPPPSSHIELTVPIRALVLPELVLRKQREEEVLELLSNLFGKTRVYAFHLRIPVGKKQEKIAARRIFAAIVDFWGGATCTKGLGGWTSENGSVVYERVHLIEVYISFQGGKRELYALRREIAEAIQAIYETEGCPQEQVIVTVHHCEVYVVNSGPR